jgi:site-specific DNA recombinase
MTRKAKQPDTSGTLIPAVGYIRMSTDDQKESPERQREEIIAMAQRDGFKILRWYEDHGLTGTESKNRPQFQLMMADVPKREFKAVLLYEQSRFSREDVFDAFAHWKILKDCGVSLISVQRGELRFDDLAGVITAVVGQHEARSESIRLAERSLSGRKRKAAEGAHAGCVPFAYDREIIDESGKVVKRVPAYQKFRRPKSWRSRLVPSEDEALIEAVRFMFRSILEGKSTRSIAIELNQRKLKTRHGKQFTVNAVRQIVTNPVYKGVLRFGYVIRGKFAHCDNDIIVVPDAHPAIVNANDFDRVQEVLKACYRKVGPTEPGRYLLSGLLYCGECGQRLAGANLTGPSYDEGGHRQYRCNIPKTGINTCSVRPCVSADAIENLVLRCVARHILCEANRPMLLHWAQWMARREDGPRPESTELDAVRFKIERGEKNLAELEGENLKVVAKQLDEWRQREKRLVERLRTADSNEVCNPLIELLSTVDGMELLRQNLHRADRLLVAAALRDTLARVTFSRDVDPNAVPHHQGFGTIEFNPEIYSGGAIEFTDSDLWPEKHYLAISKYVNEAGRPVKTDELAAHLNLPRNGVVYHARRAYKAGLVKMGRGNSCLTFAPMGNS